jgi:uncharacterized NAD-dependent epimerase/dehydratase family protein
MESGNNPARSSMLQTPYLLFLGDAPDQLAAKTAQGVRDWRPEFALGQMRLENCKADLGLPELSIAEAWDKGARTLIIGAANRGGVMSDNWMPILARRSRRAWTSRPACTTGCRTGPELVAAANAAGRKLIDVRTPQHRYPIGDGAPRRGKRCLAVGTDCSVGKMYTALAMEKAMRDLGMKATFRATGQTGILITGSGVPLDAVVADFMAGSIEWLTPDNDDDHWDLIEGQGSLFHPSFSGVTMALIHGGRPDALILCHEPTRSTCAACRTTLPSLEALRDLSLETARIVNPEVRVTGISVNTAAMSEDEANAYLAEVEARMGLPAVDPYRHGARRLAEAL